MITFHQLGGYGRLGNQLFQYAALKSLALKKNYEIKIPEPKSMNWHGQTCLLDQFNIDCEFLKEGDLNQIQSIFNEIDSMEYDEDFWSTPDNTTLQGFFQSTLYFKEFSEQVKSELTPNKQWLDESKLILDEIKKENKGYEIVSIHMRRGDNVDGTDAMPLYMNMYGKDDDFSWNSEYGSYLKKAIDTFKNKKVKFLIFTGGKKGDDDNLSDLNWCKKSFTGEEFIYPKKTSVMLDFSLIMNCDHNIMSHVSSFGWWAAYLNNNKNKIVVAPYNYHYENPKYNHRKGFYPKTYKLI